jgi:hypothetical protein
MLAILKNWRTTIVGVLLVLGVIGHALQTGSLGQADLNAILVALGFAAAGDAIK